MGARAASGTEPLFRVQAEAKDAETAEKLAARLRTVLEEAVSAVA